MKKLFMLIVVLAIVAAVDHPVVNEFYDNTLGRIKRFASETVEAPKDAGAKNVFIKMESHFDTYSDKEIALITKVTQKNRSVLKFQNNYCQKKDFNPIIYGNHMRQFCDAIRQYQAQINIVE